MTYSDLVFESNTVSVSLTKDELEEQSNNRKVAAMWSATAASVTSFVLATLLCITGRNSRKFTFPDTRSGWMRKPVI